MRTVLQKDNIFSFLDQTGPFAVEPDPPDLREFSKKSKEWVKKISLEGTATKYRVIRNQIFEILNV